MINELLANKRHKLILALIISIAAVYLVLRFLILNEDPIRPVVGFILSNYLFLVEGLTNACLHLFNAGVEIKDHSIIFNELTDFVIKNEMIIKDWQSFVLFKKWTALLLALVWISPALLRKKILFSALFIAVHFAAVFSGLLLITLIGPIIINPNSISELYPGAIGSVLMLSFLIFWIRNNEIVYLEFLSKFKVHLSYSRKSLNQICALLFVFILLKNIVIPYFNFYSYIHFLLLVTQKIVSTLGYQSTIDGPYLYGNNGSLFMAKWCLGFITLFVFSALVYLTGKKPKTTWMFISVGILFLHLVNIIRLSALFVFVQNNDHQLAENHHDIYNVVVYLIIFGMWVLWFEKFAAINLRRKS